MQLQQQNIQTWSSFHRMYLEANLTYEVTQERGYCVARLRSVEYREAPPVPVAPLKPCKTLAKVIPFKSVEYLEAPPVPMTALEPRKQLAKVIPFYQPERRTRVSMEEDEIRKVFDHLAQREFPPSRTTGT